MQRSYELADFVGGCRCMICSRVIPDGTPYAWLPKFVDDDEIVYGEVVCVYCEFSEDSDGTARIRSDYSKTN